MSSPVNGRQETPENVGRLWTLRRSGHSAHCALMALVGEWELRTIVDGYIILAERCPRGAEAFSLSDVWKRRMLADGWRQVVPAATPDPAPVTERCVETKVAPFVTTRFV